MFTLKMNNFDLNTEKFIFRAANIVLMDRGIHGGNDMKRDTTVNIDRDVYDRLQKAAETAGVSRNVMVSSAIAYSCRRERPRAAERGLVKYQSRMENGGRRRVHVGFREDEYEFFHDLRKVWKMSVSYILAQAIEKYLDELVLLMAVNPDNYRYRNYASSRIIVDNVICWVIYWGIPKKLLTGTG